jgi:hypothetical protein
MKIYAVIVSGAYIQGNGIDDFEHHYDDIHSLCTSQKQAECIAEKIKREWKTSNVNFLEDVYVEEKDVVFQSDFAENGWVVPTEAAAERMMKLGLDPSECDKWFEFFEEEKITAACKALKLVNTDVVKQRVTAEKARLDINADKIITQDISRKFEAVEFDKRLGVTYGFGKNDVQNQQNYDKNITDLFSKAENEIAIQQVDLIEELTEDCEITMSM